MMTNYSALTSSWIGCCTHFMMTSSHCVICRQDTKSSSSSANEPLIQAVESFALLDVHVQSTTKSYFNTNFVLLCYHVGFLWKFGQNNMLAFVDGFYRILDPTLNYMMPIYQNRGVENIYLMNWNSDVICHLIVILNADYTGILIRTPFLTDLHWCS